MKIKPTLAGITTCIYLCLSCASFAQTPTAATEEPSGPEIDIPETWTPLKVPENLKEKDLRGILKGGATPDGRKGALLSVIPINPEKFKEMKNPLEQLAWIVKEADKTNGFTPSSEREVQTTMGLARVITSTNKMGTLQTWVLLNGKVGVFVKLYTYDEKGTTLSPADDPDLQKVLKSLKLPKPVESDTAVHSNP